MGNACYSHNGNICYISPGKQHITFGFHKATNLTDPDALFEGTGKDLRHAKVRSLTRGNAPLL